MKIKLFNLIFLLTLFTAMQAWAQENEPANPFMPRFPKPKIEVRELPPPPPSRLLDLTKPPKTETTPSPDKAQARPSVTITGLIWDSDRPQAIINDQVFDVGDKVSEMEIVSINKTGIDVLFQGQTINITY